MKKNSRQAGEDFRFSSLVNILDWIGMPLSEFFNEDFGAITLEE